MVKYTQIILLNPSINRYILISKATIHYRIRMCRFICQTQVIQQLMQGTCINIKLISYQQQNNKNNQNNQAPNPMNAQFRKWDEILI